MTRGVPISSGHFKSAISPGLPSNTCKNVRHIITINKQIKWHAIKPTNCYKMQAIKCNVPDKYIYGTPNDVLMEITAELDQDEIQLQLVQLCTLLNWKYFRFRCGCTLVPVNWFLSLFQDVLRYLRMLYIVWSLVRRRVMHNVLKYSKTY